MNEFAYQDALYGRVKLDQTTSDLVCTPVVQRLRDVRLSNVDSISMPGIANLTRYEHSLGVAHLAGMVNLRRRLSDEDRSVLIAAGLLHDAAIAPFGHLFEEALEYVAENFHHEDKWSLLRATFNPQEVGGFGMQVLHGRDSGLQRWADRHFKSRADVVLDTIFEAVKGGGPLGKCIAGDMDLDNLDNVTRIAYHMGLELRRTLPLDIVQAVIDVTDGGVTFAESALALVSEWLDLRSQVYERLMMSPEDFCGKSMLLYAFVHAYEAGELFCTDWKLTDREIITRLLASRVEGVKETTQRWLSGEPWEVSPLMWFDGEPPSYAVVRRFVTERFGTNKRAFAYRIKDKRVRQTRIVTGSGTVTVLGTRPARWLFGVAAAGRTTIRAREDGHLIADAEKFFGVRFLEVAGASGAPQPVLWDRGTYARPLFAG